MDIILNLHNGKYYPYRKPGNLPLYINAQSDHPTSILKQLPKSINRRISDLSCDQAEFDKTAPSAVQTPGFSPPAPAPAPAKKSPAPAKKSPAPASGKITPARQKIS